jgi:pimeloyl-ACP methyl ester carboxylesterase
MDHNLKTKGKFTYLEKGEGAPIVILHGLMGGLSNFDKVTQFFSENGYKVVIPELPVYTQPLLKTGVKHFAVYLEEFITTMGYKDITLLGNSMGGHIGLYHTKHYPGNTKGLVITGSSGLYENAMGESYPKRGDYEYIKRKTEAVFYDKTIATKELVDEVYKTVNDRNMLIKTLAMAKSAIRHNMAKDLPEIHTPTCIIWGKQDSVTPPEVALDFEKLLPDSELFWIDKCGHAAMMEQPEEFNKILLNWLKKRDF